MNIIKQAGATDCALFAMAVLTSLAFGDDPLKVVYDQQQLRSHLLCSLEKQDVSLFPVLRKRRVKQRIIRIEKV